MLSSAWVAQAQGSQEQLPVLFPNPAHLINGNKQETALLGWELTAIPI